MEPDYKKLYEEEHKKYEETLSRAKGLIDGMKEENVNATKEDIKNLFPGEELEESENERIRKNCIHFLELQKKHHAATFEIEECITWLTSLKDTLAFLEKQIEQEPAESPKFKVGDIITHNKANLIYKVVSVNSTGSYYVENIETCGRIALSYAEQNYHLWTIQDAKDGDVLEFSDHGRIVIGIVSYVNKVTGKVDVNCLLEDNNFKLGNYYALDTIKPHPATKEQYNLLFTKMKEAGYEWDAEDKVLKKIEQKSAWSEEDRIRITNCIQLIGKTGDGEVEWLKSLESRILPQIKPEWCGEDESMYIRTLDILGKCYMGDLPTKVEEELDWLKSLKDRVVPQNTWKPTEEQMKTLESAAREAEYNQRFKEADALWSLDKDLKKL